MANTQRVLSDYYPPRAYPVKGSAEAIQVGDLAFWEARFQASTSQTTLRPASAGSAGASAADGRKQFADLFAGVAGERHDLNSYDKNILVHVNCEVEYTIANSSGVATAANADVAPGTLVGAAVDTNNKPLTSLVQIDGLHSVTVASNQAIGMVSRQVKNGDRTVRVHIQGTHVMTNVGV
jgi:hypothetical protein